MFVFGTAKFLTGGTFETLTVFTKRWKLDALGHHGILMDVFLKIRKGFFFR